MNDVCYSCNMTSRISAQRCSTCKGFGHCYVLAVTLYIFTCYRYSSTTDFPAANLRFHSDKSSWSNQL